MARVLKLKRGSNELNLLSAEGSGWRATAWNPAVAPVRYGGPVGPLEETVEAIVERDSDDHLAASVQALDEMAFWASAYVRDRTVEEPVWLHAKMTSETGERRALVHSIGYELSSPLISATGHAKTHRAKAQIAIVREPYWESITKEDLPPANLPPAASKSYDYTALPIGSDIAGDVPARISLFKLTPTGMGHTFGKVWAGLRSADKRGSGGLSNFANVWECEDGAMGTSASVVAEGSASGSQMVRVLSGGTGMHRRLLLQLMDVTAHYQDNCGKYLWLLRCRTAGKWRVQLRYGQQGMDDADYVQGEIYEVSNASWEFLETDVAAIPLFDPQIYPFSFLQSFWALQVWAEEVQSGNLELDCLCPLPVDEGFLKSWGFSLSNLGQYLYFRSSPRDTSQCAADDMSIPPFSVDGFELPPGDGRMIVVHETPTGSILTRLLTVVQGGYYPRWRTLRGAE